MNLHAIGYILTSRGAQFLNCHQKCSAPNGRFGSPAVMLGTIRSFPLGPQEPTLLLCAHDLGRRGAFKAGRPRQAHSGELLPGHREVDQALPLRPVGRHGELQGRFRFALRIVVGVHAPDIVAGRRKRQVAGAP